MRAENLTVVDELIQASRRLAWSQWADLGVSSWETPRNASLVDLEPLIAFTAQLWRFDPRLGAQALDWSAANMPLVSLHQLRSVITRHRWSFQGPVADFSATAEHFTHKKWPRTGDSQLLLRSLPGKAKHPDLGKPSLLSLRVRAIFGLGARAEIIRHLLFHDWSHTPSQLGRAISYGSRQISNDLRLLEMSGVVRRHQDGSVRSYRLARPEDVSRLTGPPTAEVVPWGCLFKVLTELLDLYGDVHFRSLQSPRAAFARRLRLLKPELARLSQEEWWRSPEAAASDDVEAWVHWLAEELPSHL